MSAPRLNGSVEVDISSQQNILIVDDQPANLRVLSLMLNQKYQVRAVRSGVQAIESAAKNPQPDLILLDIMMPEMDGYDVCRRLKQDPVTSSIPIIFVTARDSPDDEQKGLELGAVDYITKPINPAIVMARVHTHLSLSLALRRLKENNAQLMEAAQLRDDIDRILRHDLKSPLGGLIGIPDLLEKTESLSEAGKRLLTMMKQGGYRMLEMINLSLDIYKMETGRYRLDPKPVDLPAVLHTVCSEQEAEIQRKGLTLNIEIAPHLLGSSAAGQILGEEMLCYTLFSNILKNAVEASNPGDEIDIRLMKDNDQVVVSVFNQGVVPESIRGCFFDKYVTSGKQKGTGLGTYSAKLLTEVQQGTIVFETDKRGGTELIVCLPGV
jgi:CheY-like chemotaxis protein